MKYKLRKGNNIELLKKLPDNSVDSIVSDPPYGLSFMNKKWDYDVPSVDFWKEAYRVLKPGGHVLSFGGTRTYHRMVVNMEDAGFEIRDQIMWLYGSGFPKSLNVGKAVDKLEGNEREVVGKQTNLAGRNETLIGDRTDSAAGMFSGVKKEIEITKGNSEWEGWGTALKPANEPICLARKPLSEKSVAENVLKWGVGGINVDGCRVGSETISSGKSKVVGGGQLNGSNTRVDIEETFSEGRFPANVILECICDEVINGGTIPANENYKWSNTNSDSDIFKGRGKYTPREDKIEIHTNPHCPCRLLDEQSGISKSSGSIRKKDTETEPSSIDRKHKSGENSNPYAGEQGGASRFFYNAKVSKAERNMGLEPVEIFHQRPRREDGSVIYKETHYDEWVKAMSKLPRREKTSKAAAEEKLQTQSTSVKNIHPTVKPINLMAYLCRLVTPPNGIILDPYMGSGSTGIAALLEGFKFIGMEMDEEYFNIASTRIENYEKYRKFIK